MFGPFERYIRATQPLDWEPILWFLAVFVFLLLSWLFSVWVYQKQDL
jgi:hypothetical protein